MDKLSKLQNIIEVLDKDTVTQDEFVEMFGVLIDFVGQIKEGNEQDREELNATVDKALAKLKDFNTSEWAKIRAKIESIRDGLDGRDGVDGRDGRDGKDGKDGKDGEKGESGLDLFPNTPNEEVDKINEATNQINAERVKGLSEVVSRQIPALPPTTTHFYKNGTRIGRAKNVNFESTGSADVTVAGDLATVKVTYITVSDTAPENPNLNDLWVDTSA
jgi:hypothetical protein